MGIPIGLSRLAGSSVPVFTHFLSKILTFNEIVLNRWGSETSPPPAPLTELASESSHFAFQAWLFTSCPFSEAIFQIRI